jgi:hypothetical protein
MTLSQDILKKMMELPNRGAGTLNEQHAADYLRSVYKYFGVEPKEHQTSILPNSLINHLILSFSLILLTMAVNLLNITILTLGVFVLSVLVYFRIFNFPFRFFKRRGLSRNIYAEIPAKEQEKYTLVFTANYDTPNNLGPIYSILGTIYSYLRPKNSSTPMNLPEYLVQPLIFSNLAFGVTLLSLFLPDNYAKFFFGFIVGTPLVIAIYFLIKGRNNFTKGAYSNGVATSMLVELASNLKKNPLNNTKVIFANVAAGQTLTKGALPLLQSLNLDREKTFIIDLNCVGEEEITLIKAEPSYPLGLEVPYDVTFDVLADFAQDIFPGRFNIINSPVQTVAQDLVFAGYRVMASVATLPINGYPTNFNSVKDVYERIKWENVEEVRDFLTSFMAYFDAMTQEVNL